MNNISFEDNLQSLDRNITYIIYDENNSQSSLVMGWMNDWDFDKVYNMEGGFKGWKDAGIPWNIYRDLEVRDDWQ